MNEKRAHNFIDLTNQKIGRLTVIEYFGLNIHGRTIWRCKCECGNEITTLGKYLKNGDTKSCGCLHGDIMTKRNHEGRKYNETTYNYAYGCHRKAAKKRGFIPLNRKDWEGLVSQPCFYCGEMDIRNGTTSHLTRCLKNMTKEEIKRYEIQINGIDRLNSELGYLIENSVPCCYMCNIMKHAFSKDKFLNKIKQIHKNLNLDRD